MIPPRARTRSVRDVAITLRLCEKTIRRKLASGEIPGKKIGGRWMVLDTVLESMVEGIGQK